MALPQLAAGVGVGVYLKGGNLKDVAFWSGTTWVITQTVVHPITTTKTVASSAQYIWTTPAKTMTADLLGSTAVQTVAGTALGYAAGATVGTALVAQAEKEGRVYEGATKDVLGFYGFDAGGMEPHYWDQKDRPTPGYFNIPGNVKYILKHYTS